MVRFDSYTLKQRLLQEKTHLQDSVFENRNPVDAFLNCMADFISEALFYYLFQDCPCPFRLSEMLVYTDIYPIQLPARYANTYACYETVYIVSNWSLESQFTDAQETSPESWNAFLRRIHEVRIFNVDGTVTIYDSVEKYLKRNEEFHTIDSDIKPPFEGTKENEVHTNEQ